MINREKEKCKAPPGHFILLCQQRMFPALSKARRRSTVSAGSVSATVDERNFMKKRLNLRSLPCSLHHCVIPPAPRCHQNRSNESRGWKQMEHFAALRAEISAEHLRAAGSRSSNRLELSVWRMLNQGKWRFCGHFVGSVLFRSKIR